MLSEHHEQADGGPKPRLVTVTIDGVDREIPAGEYTGASLKRTLGVPAGYVLERVSHGKFDEIKDEERTRIRGGEKFVSHCGQGQSS